MNDPVNNPSHYNQAGIEVIDVIETYVKDDYRLGNVIKYVCRSSYKGNKLQDLQKAAWYLNRVVAELEDEYDLALLEERKRESEIAKDEILQEVRDWWEVVASQARVAGNEDSQLHNEYYKWDPKSLETYCVQCDSAIYAKDTYVVFNDGINDLPFCCETCRSNFFDEVENTRAGCS